MELIKITIAVTASDGGEGGIRTLGRGKPTHAFQACAFNRSATSPLQIALSGDQVPDHN